MKGRRLRPGHKGGHAVALETQLMNLGAYEHPGIAHPHLSRVVGLSSPTVHLQLEAIKKTIGSLRGGHEKISCKQPGPLPVVELAAVEILTSPERGLPAIAEVHIQAVRVILAQGRAAQTTDPQQEDDKRPPTA